MEQETFGTDGIIGLGVLGLMAIALIAGEVRANLKMGDAADAGAVPAPPGVLIELRPQLRWPADAEIEGTIRELGVLPLSIDRLDLGWAPEDVVIEQYRRSDF